MLRKLTIILISLVLCWTTLACSSAPSPTPSQNSNISKSSSQTKLADGKYAVQQATYDDANGEYTLMLLDTPAGTPPIFRTADLQMARLTDEEIAGGKKSYLQADNAKASLHLTEDFKIEYVHNVTQTQTNSKTGQPETIVVRQESNFWSPFAGALAGQAIGSLLFTPHYYMPPIYQPGVPMVGYGGYGRTYNQAVEGYQSRYQAPPAAVRNRVSLRTTGNLRSPSSNPSATNRQTSPNNNRSTGSGFGSSTLRQSDKSRPSQTTKRPSSFGSNRRPASSSRRR